METGRTKRLCVEVGKLMHGRDVTSEDEALRYLVVNDMAVDIQILHALLENWVGLC